jgi:hypothetical protein
MKVIHQCQSTIGWQPVPVRSHTNDQKVYVVHVNPWGRIHESICECPGYVNRGRCRHQQEAAEQLCGWHELIGPEEQDEVQRRVGQCPRCGDQTIRQVHEDLDDES